MKATHVSISRWMDLQWNEINQPQMVILYFPLKWQFGIVLIFFKKIYPFKIYLSPDCAAYGVLVPWPGIEPAHSALKVQTPNCWTIKEFPLVDFFYDFVNIFFKHLFVLLLLFWRWWVFVAACGLSSSCCEQGLATLCCGARASHCGGFSYCGAQALATWASVVRAHGL